MTTTLTPNKRPKYKAHRGSPVKLSTDRRFVMVGHTVKVLADYDDLRGDFGEVVGADFGDGKVLVKFRDGREVCFLSCEVQIRPGGSNYSYSMSDLEEPYLSGRIHDLRGHRYDSIFSTRVMATLNRRVNVGANSDVTGALRHSGPKRVKRRWGGTVCGVLVLVLLSALAGWLLHCVRHAAMPMAVRIPGLAVMPWVAGSVVGLLGFFSMAVIWKVALWVKRRDDEVMARWSAAERRDEESLARWEAVPEPAKAGTTIPGEDPLALPYIGMKQEDLLRILASLIVECCMAEELVRKWLVLDVGAAKGPIYCPNCNALAGINPAAVPVRLREAMNCLHGLKVCLGKLADCAAKGSEKPATAEVAP